MKIFNWEVSFKNVLNGLVVSYVVMLLLGFVLRGENQYFDVTTLLLGEVLGLTFLVTLRISRGFLFQIMAMTTVLFCLYIFSRILGYLWLPAFVRFPFGAPMTAAMINQGLSYVVLGTVAIFLGIYSSYYVGRKWKRTLSFEQQKSPFQIFNPVIVFVLFFIAISINGYFSYGLGLMPFAKLQVARFNILVQLLLLIFNIDMMFLVGLTMLCVRRYRREFSRRVNLWLIISFIIVYFLYMTMAGSRSAGLRILQMIIAVTLVIGANIKTKWHRYFSVVIILGLMSIFTYPLATQIRINVAKYFTGKKYKVDQDASMRLDSIFTCITNEEDGWGLYGRKQKFIATVTNRLGLLDYGLLLITQPANEQAKKKFINLKYIGKRIINMLVPGNLYPDATFSTSRLLVVFYRGFSEEYLRGHGYFSEFYTLWGLMFLFLDWHVWAWITFFLLGVLFYGSYLLVSAGAGRYRAVYESWFLFGVPGLIFLTTGMDDSIVGAIISFISASIAIIMIVGGSWLFSRKKTLNSEAIIANKKT